VYESVYKRRRVRFGERYIEIDPAMMARLKLYLTCLGLCDPSTPRAFYDSVNGDTTLVELLDLHREAMARGAAVSDLPRLYDDSANICPSIIDDYKALLLHDFDLANVEVQVNKEPNEKLTEAVRTMFDRLDEGGFESLIIQAIEAGLIYGDMFMALSRDAQGRIWGYYKEAPSVFALTEYAMTTIYAVNFFEYVAGKKQPVEYSELYAIGKTEVWKAGELIPELSGETGIDEPAFVQAPLLHSRGEAFGKSAIKAVIETIATMCGVEGSAVRALRQDINGLIAISGDDAVEALDALCGKDNPSSKRTTSPASAISPDNVSILAGRNLAVTRVDTQVGQTVPPYLAHLEEALLRKCPIYALKKLGANASGEAIKLTLKQLEATVKAMRIGINEFVRHTARIGMKLQGTPLPDDAKAVVNWGSVLPESPAEKQARILALHDKGLVPDEYILRELDLDGDELVQKHLANKAKAAEAQAAAQANPFADLFRMQ